QFALALCCHLVYSNGVLRDCALMDCRISSLATTPQVQTSFETCYGLWMVVVVGWLQSPGSGMCTLSIAPRGDVVRWFVRSLASFPRSRSWSVVIPAMHEPAPR